VLLALTARRPLKAGVGQTSLDVDFDNRNRVVIHREVRLGKGVQAGVATHPTALGRLFGSVGGMERTRAPQEQANEDHLTN
jgi:hypothetical protein